MIGTKDQRRFKVLNGAFDVTEVMVNGTKIGPRLERSGLQFSCRSKRIKGGGRVSTAEVCDPEIDIGVQQGG